MERKEGIKNTFISKKEALFKQIDSDGSGEIDYFEFQTCFINDEKILTDDLIEMCFKFLDIVEF